ncbi:MAG: TonB-dependent receptor, partial [Novosphingobium sp.]
WDVNNVPADLIERVDVVTGGNSAIYGSDAISGVVNFVLRRSFDGIQIRGQAGVSGEGDSGSQFVSGTFGRNFADGRGNITFAAEYAHQDALYVVDRAQGRDRRQFQLTQNTGINLNPSAGPLRSTGEPQLGDGISDTTFIGGLQRVATSVGGTFSAACPTVAATGESAAAFTARRALACSGIFNPGSSNPIAQFGAAFAFQPDGTLVPNGCITDFRGFGSGNCIGGLGSTLRESGQFQPMLERVNATMLGHYEFSPAFEAFFEGQYTHINAIQEGSPTFGTQSAVAAQSIVFSTSNPFLTSQARNVLTQVLAPGTTTFSIDRQNLDFGSRGERHKRETYRIVVGARGTFNTDWNYEISANYGHFSSFYQTEGNIVRTKYANAIQAVLAPTGYAGSNFALNSTGQKVVCSINADTITTNDDSACIPVNLFGAGQVSQAALNYFGYKSTRNQTNSQFIVNGFVSGDTSGFFNLPGGPLGFAIGGEYREEKQQSAYDDTTANGLTFLNLSAPFAPPKYKVTEGFAEVRVPIVKDAPFFKELTLEGAVRVSHYSVGSTGTVYAYNGGLIWAPSSDIKFRASYQRSVRAPTLGDLFSAGSQSFANNFQDPCSQSNISKGPNRVKNCAAAGVPTTQTFNGTTEPFTNVPSGGIPFLISGNPNLREERSDSWTYGLVATPSFIPGLSLSLDYYKINIKNVIFSLGAQTVIDQCYDSTTGINNQFCSAVFRLTNGTFAGQSGINHGGSIVTLNNPGFATLSGGFNYARLNTSGVDADLNYVHEFNSDAKLTFRGIVSYLINRDAYPDVTDPTFRDRIKSELGDPEWRFQLSTALKLGQFTISHKAQYIGKQLLGAYETYFPLDGRDPTNPDATPFAYYPAKWYHDFRFEAEVNDRFKFYVGIDNAFDVRPPFDLLGTEGGSLYDPTGRFFYAGFKANF